MYRVKPLLHRIAESGDPQLYVGGLDTSTDLSDWATDEEGFRNAHAAPRCDVVLIGDGMINTGRTLADTFGARLADHLDGWCVANLGIAGHGPFQYLQTLKTYGTKKHPRFTILAFNEGNDLQDIGKYIAWKSGSPASFTGGYEVGIANPLRRFTTAASETWMYLRQQTWNGAAATVFPAIHSESSTHSLAGNLARIHLPSGAVFPMVFIDREPTKSPREIEQSGDWHRLEVDLDVQNDM